MTMKLTFLGIGSNSFESLSTTSFALSMQNTVLLIDCGPDTPRQIQKAGINFLSITHLIITHRHLDHCLGLPYFLFGRQLQALARRRAHPDTDLPQLNIVAEADTWGALQSLFRYAHPDVPKLAFDVVHTEISQFISASRPVGDLDLRVVPVIHAVPAYGLLFSFGDQRVLAYSSDTLVSEQFIELARGVRVLIHEAMVPSTEEGFSRSAKHSTALDAGRAIRQIAPGQSYLIHLRPTFASRRSDLEQEAAAAAGVHTAYPEEGASVEIQL